MTLWVTVQTVLVVIVVTKGSTATDLFSQTARRMWLHLHVPFMKLWSTLLAVKVSVVSAVVSVAFAAAADASTAAERPAGCKREDQRRVRAGRQGEAARTAATATAVALARVIKRDLNCIVKEKRVVECGIRQMDAGKMSGAERGSALQDL